MAELRTPNQVGHPCPGGCGTQLLLAARPCERCRLRLPGQLRARLEVATPHRHSQPTEYAEALAAVLDWFRTNPPAQEG